MSAELPAQAEIVVIGGGVMGASTAYHLAKAGVGDVVLLEREPHFGAGATGRCAGGVRYQFSTEVNVLLSIVSLKMMEAFEAETGQNPYYRKCGYLFVLTREEDVEAFHNNVAMQRRLGVGTRWMTGDEIRARLPMMRFEDALGGTIHDKDGVADPNSLVMGYIKAGRELGVRALTDIAVVDIQTMGGHLSHLSTSVGDISCRAAVNAAGPWGAEVGAMAGVEIPITPLRRQWVTTTPLPDLPHDFPFVIDFAQSLYFHPEGEGLLTGMSNPSEGPGFDQRVDPDWELVAMQAAIERMPMLGHAGRLSGLAGLYEVTPDAHPIFGPTPLEGFWIVGGFSGHGFMHGPVAGKLMSEYILGGAPQTVDVSMLDLARFEQGRLIQEYNVV
jgi:sarcosine oxidase subunit beta